MLASCCTAPGGAGHEGVAEHTSHSTASEPSFDIRPEGESHVALHPSARADTRRREPRARPRRTGGAGRAIQHDRASRPRGYPRHGVQGAQRPERPGLHRLSVPRLAHQRRALVQRLPRLAGRRARVLRLRRGQDGPRAALLVPGRRAPGQLDLGAAVRSARDRRPGRRRGAGPVVPLRLRGRHLRPHLPVLPE